MVMLETSATMADFVIDTLRVGSHLLQESLHVAFLDLLPDYLHTFSQELFHWFIAFSTYQISTLVVNLSIRVNKPQFFFPNLSFLLHFLPLV